MVHHVSRHTVFIRRRDRITLRAADQPERFILISCPGNNRHILCGQIMLFIRQPMRIRKFRIFTSQLLCLLIHHFYEFLHRSADMLCNRIRTFICRFQHHRVQTLLHGHYFADITPNTRSSACLIDRILRKRNHFIHAAVFNGNQSCQNLCDTCRIICFVDIFLI